MRGIRLAVESGRSATDVMREIARTRFGPGRLTHGEYAYYRLWDPQFARGDVRAFVGKAAQHAMHVAANSVGWNATCADKILFDQIMQATECATPEMIAVTGRGRTAARAPTLDTHAGLQALLRRPDAYPLFAKPTRGKYSIDVANAEGRDETTDEVTLVGSPPTSAAKLAERMLVPEGYVIQRRLEPHTAMRPTFGERLCSVRLLVLLTDGEPTLHRATMKIAVAGNPADNYWRPGNMLAEVDRDTGAIDRTVTGTAETLRTVEAHPDTALRPSDATIPGWRSLVADVLRAAPTFAGVRTQSWDVALSAPSHAVIEMNYGGDMNLHQLASGRGVMDATFERHLRRCGYRGRF